MPVPPPEGVGPAVLLWSAAGIGLAAGVTAWDAARQAKKKVPEAADSTIPPSPVHRFEMMALGWILTTFVLAKNPPSSDEKPDPDGSPEKDKA